MGAKVITDSNYTQDIDGNDVYILIIQKNDVSSFGRAYTVPELQDIADTINKFMKSLN